MKMGQLVMWTCLWNSLDRLAILAYSRFKTILRLFSAARLIWALLKASNRESVSMLWESVCVSPKNWQSRIGDILDAIAEIKEFTERMDFSSFRTDAKTVRAVELDLIIIGEATNQIPAQIQEQYPQIPWTLMRAMRNRLVHVYFSIDEALLWDTVQNDLPPLESALKALLD
jgi:uncharacterized protein with HEPN domain